MFACHSGDILHGCQTEFKEALICGQKFYLGSKKLIARQVPLWLQTKSLDLMNKVILIK